MKERIRKNDVHRLLYWICKEWKVLPTEDRFKNLTQEQLDWILLNEEITREEVDGKVPQIPGNPEANEIVKAANGEIEVSKGAKKAQKQVQNILSEFMRGVDASGIDVLNSNAKSQTVEDDFEDITDELMGDN